MTNNILVCPDCRQERAVSRSMACMVRKGRCSGLCMSCSQERQRVARRLAAEAMLGERFWSKTERDGDCLVWTARRCAAGYGGFRITSGKWEKAHRVAWILSHGVIPDGLLVLHRCDNPPCVNPEHLWLGTHADNMRDMAEKGRQRGGRQRVSRCCRGHDMEVTRSKCGRYCLECNRIRARAQRGVNHHPIMWTQLARCTITTRFRELGPGGLGCYEVVGRPDGGVGVCWYVSGDEGRARRAHAVLSRRLRRVEAEIAA